MPFMIINDPKEISFLRQGGRILVTILNLVASQAKAGTASYDLDYLAEQEIRKCGGIPCFKNYRARKRDHAFPSSLCVSVNDEVVHGIPTKNKILKSGDIVGLDLGVLYQGFYTDAALTIPIGEVDQTSLKLIAAAKECLNKAIKIIKPGKFTGDIGAIIESTAQKYGFVVVRELVGHGVGWAVHEEPEIPCFGKVGTGTKLVEGMVIAVEPMINEKGWKVIFNEDRWTIKTQDGGRSAHMEHTLLVTKNSCEILTNMV